jgi:hypothetical protein
MRLKASRADPGACYIILNSHCCQRTRSLLKFCIDLADILLVGSPGSALLISQMLTADNRGGIPGLFGYVAIESSSASRPLPERR